MLGTIEEMAGPGLRLRLSSEKLKAVANLARKQSAREIVDRLAQDGKTPEENFEAMLKELADEVR